MTSNFLQVLELMKEVAAEGEDEGQHGDLSSNQSLNLPNHISNVYLPDLSDLFLFCRFWSL
jgi:hypothetical protein